MKFISAFLILFSIPSCLFAQQIIKGKVVNASNGIAISGSSIFITNTSKGTISASDGSFQLNDVPAGKHELIISCIGYETNIFSFSDDQLPLQLKVELTIKVKELENVTVEPSVEEGWDKWGKAFMDNFIGNTATASQCRIKNEDKIKFRYYKKSNRLVAYCEEPVLIENKALGYLISYQLENFEVNFSDRSMFFLGYSLYEPMENDKKNRQEKWEKNRQEAYNGSVLHFMRSLYTGHLADDGFEVRRMVRTPNYEKQRVKIVYAASRIIKKNGSTGIMTIENNPKVPADSMSYYESVMRQNDYLDKYSADLLTADSLIAAAAGDYKGLQFDDYLYITYKNEVEEAGYLKTQYPARKATYQRSYVTLLNDKLISVDKNGNYYNPQDFFTSAYWAWSEKMSNSLPLDYEPNKR